MSNDSFEVDSRLRLTVGLCGPFRMSKSDGSATVLRSAKAQGLIALLATSPSRSRTRAWVQDKLWSDRSREQGSASLRQTLTEIRKCFGRDSSFLLANRKTITLNQETVAVLEEPQDGQFLEGLDIRDPEFEEWLRLERQRVANSGTNRHSQGPDTGIEGPATPLLTRATRRALVCYVQFQDWTIGLDPVLQAVGDTAVDAVSLTLREVLGVQSIRSNDRGSNTLSSGVHVPIRLEYSLVREGPKVVLVRMIAIEQETGVTIWTGKTRTVLQGVLPCDASEILALANEIVEAVADYLFRASIAAADSMGVSAQLSIALKQIFSMTAEGFKLGDASLSMIDPIHNFDGLIDAWRSHLRAISLVERLAEDPAVALEEGRMYAAKAAMGSQTNSLALAALANASLILNQDVIACDEFSRRAIAANAATPLGWWSRSAAHLYSGKYENAYRDAEMASRLTQKSPFKFWWDFKRGLSAAMTGRLHEAVDQLSRSAVNGPSFRPSLRYLVALQALTGDVEGARVSSGKLASLEPDFKIERLEEDETYPVSLMRKKELVPKQLSKLLR